MRTPLISILTAIALTACGGKDSDNNNPNREAPPVIVLHGEAGCDTAFEDPYTSAVVCCSNGIDDDADGVMDNFDQDCKNYLTDAPYMGASNEAGYCNDGADNDQDGEIDCDDQDCYDDPACYGEEDEEPEVDTDTDNNNTDTDNNNTDNNNTEAETQYTFIFDDCDGNDMVELVVMTEAGGSWDSVEQGENLCGGNATLRIDGSDGETHVWVYAKDFSVYSDDGSNFMVWSNGYDADGSYDSWPSSNSGSVTSNTFSATPSNYTWFNLELVAQ